MAPHGQDPFGVPTLFTELTVCLLLPAYMHVYSGITRTLTSDTTGWPYTRFEQMTGFEPANLLLGKQAIYQLIYICMDASR